MLSPFLAERVILTSGSVSMTFPLEKLLLLLRDCAAPGSCDGRSITDFSWTTSQGGHEGS